METTNEVRKTQEQILDEIKKAEMIIIHRHIHPDPDAIGSQCGLAELIQSSFPEKTVKTAGEVPGDLTFLAHMNPPTDKDFEEALVISVDTANEPRVDDQRYTEGKSLIKIDHHPKDTPYGDIEWNDTNASSCSEMITEFWLAFQDDLKMTDEAARLLYAGIVGDTNRFLYDATTPRTMNLAAKLMEFDFSPTDLNNTLNSVPPAVAKLMGHVLESTEVEEESGFAKVLLTQDKLKEYGLGDEQTHSVVSLPSQIQGSLLWAIFVEQEDGTYRCHLRSKGPAINTVAKAHGGGGHPLASGASVETLDDVKAMASEMKSAGKEWKKGHRE